MAIKGYWRFNGNSNDASGNNYTLTNVNSPTFDLNTISFGNPNINKYSYVANSLGFAYGQNNITISFCVKFLALPTSVSSFSWTNIFLNFQLRNGTVRSFYRFAFDNINGTYSITLWDGSFVSVPVTVAANKWYHFYYTTDTSGNKKLFWDGKLIYTGSNSTSDSASSGGTDLTNIAIGASYYAPTVIVSYSPLAYNDLFVDNTTKSNANAKNEFSRVKGFF